MKFSLMLFSGALERLPADEYRRVIALARRADNEGFEGIWFPERHLTQFGGPYPNPLLLLSAIASLTGKLALRAGSLVAPLHDPLRMAEDLSVIDNLSNGRIEVAFASGWHPNDFVFSPATYDARREITVERAREVGQLWSGNTISRQNGRGDIVEVRMFPEPQRRSLPVWLTAAGSPETYVAAGRYGYDLLTHVLGGDLATLEKNIGRYRQARADAHHDPARGRVALMLHTFLAGDEQAAAACAAGPFVEYLKSIAPLGKGLADARSHNIDLDKLEPDQLDRFAKFQFDRLCNGRSLIGTPEGVLATLESMERIGVDEIACLIDFGVAGPLVEENFHHLVRLKNMTEGVLAGSGGLRVDNH